MIFKLQSGWFFFKDLCELGAVHKVRHAREGEGDVREGVTVCDRVCFLVFCFATVFFLLIQ